jgi:phosphatidate cytidylyltransferase
MGSVLRTRLTLGSVLVACAVLLFWLDRDVWPTIPSTVVIILLSLAAQFEFYLMARDDGHQPAALLGLLMGAGWMVGIALDWPREHFLAASVAVLLVISVLTQRVQRSPRRLGSTLLGILAVPVLLSYLIHIRGIPDGWAWLVFVVAVSKAGDSCAFFVGSAFGRHKLIPAVSPKKSWEGAIASIFGGVGAGAIVAYTAFDVAPDPFIFVSAAIVTNIGAQFGDLSESLLKRGFRTKDSASLMPAFGGTFDLVDSFLLAGPAFFAVHSYLHGN